MKKILDTIYKVPTLKIVIYCIALAYLFFCIDAISSFGIGFSSIYHWRAWVIILFAALWWCTLTENRFFYYAYIFCAFISMILIFVYKNLDDYQTIFRALFPLHLLFAGVLILDLKRVIFLAHHKRSTK